MKLTEIQRSLYKTLSVRRTKLSHLAPSSGTLDLTFLQLSPIYKWGRYTSKLLKFCNSVSWNYMGIMIILLVG